MRTTWLAMMIAVAVLGMVAGCATTDGDQGEAVPAPADEKPPVNTLKWTTASEVDNFGFDIYRSLEKDGPFERITAEPMPGAGTTDEPQKYVFVDEEIDPAKDYFYYIESISLGGIREKFSPVIRSPAKRPQVDKD